MTQHVSIGITLASLTASAFFFLRAFVFPSKNHWMKYYRNGKATLFFLICTGINVFMFEGNYGLPKNTPEWATPVSWLVYGAIVTLIVVLTFMYKRHEKHDEKYMAIYEWLLVLMTVYTLGMSTLIILRFNNVAF